MQDDPSSPEYNVPERVAAFVAAAKSQAETSIGTDVMFLMGTDFTYANAQVRARAPPSIARALGRSAEAFSVG